MRSHLLLVELDIVAILWVHHSAPRLQWRSGSIHL